MRIALVNQPWGLVKPPVTRGGSIPILLYEMARRLALQHDVSYYTRGAFRTRTERESNVDFEFVPVTLDKALYRLQGKVKVVPESAERPFWASDWCFRQFATGVGRSTRRRATDIVHIINYSQLVPVIRQLNPDSRIILHMQCEWLNQIDRTLARERASKADMLVGCSDYITRELQKAFPEYADRCRTLYNGVFVDRFKPIERAPGKDAERIIFCARIAPEKGIHTLIDAFAMVAGRFPKLQLDLVGPDEIIPLNQQVTVTADPEVVKLAPFYEGDVYGRHLIDLVRKHGLENRVHFHGAVGHNEGLVDLYQRADLAVMPSIWDEPFGIPVIEAMAVGIPVIVTRVGAFPELIQDGKTGLIIDRANPAAMARAIERLVTDPHSRQAMGRAAQQRAVADFSWDRIVSQLDGLYQETMSFEPVADRNRSARPARRPAFAPVPPALAGVPRSLWLWLGGIIAALALDGTILRLLQPVAQAITRTRVAHELKELSHIVFALIVAGLVMVLHFTRWRGAALIALSAVVAKCFYAVAKSALPRPLPTESIAPYDLPSLGEVTAKLSTLPSAFWPSGHTSIAFAMAAAMSYLLPRGRWIFFGTATLVGIQRITELAHYPSEIVLFAGLGVLAFKLTRKLLSLAAGPFPRMLEAAGE